MKRIRIGKDLLVRWPIITNGEPASLEGRDIRLELVPPSCERVVIPYTIAGNIVVVRISPELQHSVGRYSLTLWENYGEEGQTVVDSCCAFVLVSNSSAESDGIDPDVEIETVELESGELSFTLVGYRKMEVDDVLSTTSENPVQNKVVAEALSQKVDKVDGKQLTTEDFTAALKQKLESLSNYDDTQIKELVAALRNDFNALVSGDTSAAIDNYNEIIAFLSNISEATSLEDIIAGVKVLIPTKTSDLNNDSGFITEHQPLKTINGQSIVGEGNIEIKGGSGASVNVDSELSTTSENPVQNKTITVELNKKGTYSKPAVGIPKSDLESSVQESLSKANTALQTHQDISGKVDKVDGKQLSTEDFTTLLKQKLESLSNYDDTAINAAVSSLQTQLNTLVSGNADTAINSFNEIMAFLEGIKDSENLDSIIASIEQQIAAKQDAISDLDAIRIGAAKGATALQQHQSLDGYAKTTDLATVATSGSYTDLNDKPTIPTVPNDVSAFNNDAGYITDETIFKESAAYDIDSNDIANWDGKISGDGTILKVVKVSALPSSPDANTLYVIV